jgi:hypothetical protein
MVLTLTAQRSDRIDCSYVRSLPSAPAKLLRVVPWQPYGKDSGAMMLSWSVSLYADETRPGPDGRKITVKKTILDDVGKVKDQAYRQSF